MHVHASCAARDGEGVLLVGPSGSGKSDLLLRLLAHGFQMVADDQVELLGGQASPPPALAGLLEVRGLGIVRLAHVAPVRVALAVQLRGPERDGPERDRAGGSGPEGAGRLPEPASADAILGVPVMRLDAACASAVVRVSLALDCATGRVAQVAGLFAPVVAP